MDLIREVLEQLRILFDTLRGKMTVKSWQVSISNSADSIIDEIEKRDKVTFSGGELCLKDFENQVKGIITLYFIKSGNQAVQYRAERIFDKKIFVKGEIEKFFLHNKELKYPIEHSDSE